MAYRRERTIILAALLTALGAVLGFLLAGIPNVELMTLVAFLAGAFCGGGLGAASGALSILFYSLLNPLGPAPIPLLFAQVAGFLVIGAVGGFAGPHLGRDRRRSVVASAAAGFAVTLLYDALTTLATAFIVLGAGGFGEGVRGVFVAGAVFVAWHVAVNTLIFGAAVPPLMRAVRAWQGEGASASS